MRKIYRILILMIVGFAAYAVMNGNKVYAASASITPSKTVEQGSSVTVTGSVTAGAWNLTLSGNGQSKSLVGQTSIVGNQSASTSISFTASNVGSYTFTLSGDITDFDTDVTTYPKATCVINVVAKQAPAASTAPSGGGTSSSGGNSNGGSGNNGSSNTSTETQPTLSNLGINPNDFSGFTASKTSYTVNVPNTCTSVNLYASSKNGTISGTGNKTLKEGTNKFSVTVSNSVGSKTYTVSVVRATAESEDVPNVIEEESTEEKPEGIRLSSLEIDGYEFDKEFNSDVYLYTVKVSDEITLDSLEEVKEKIKAVANTENVEIVKVASISEDGVATISIIVKDDDKEYAKYVINFEQEKVEEQDEELVAGIITDAPSNDNGGSGFSLSNLSKKTKSYLFLIAYGITFFTAVTLAYISYLQTRKIAEYEQGEKEKEGQTDAAMRAAELENLKNSTSGMNMEVAEEKLGKLNGYRNLSKATKGPGRHF